MKDAQKAAAEFWGVDATSIVAVEEMGELIQALMKYRRATHRKKSVPTTKSRTAILDNIAEEIADVRICLDEIVYLLSLKDEVKKWKIKKREREDRRVVSEKRKREKKKRFKNVKGE